MAIKSKFKEQMNQWKDEGGEIKLPFDAPVFWVMNGSAQYKPLAQTTPALYFGGFATSANELETLGNVPKGLVKSDFTPRGADASVEVYSTRHIIIAPFGKRLSSVEKSNGTRYPGYHKGASPHLQLLCYLAERGENKSLVPMYPIVVTAKGFQVGNILDALREWESKTAKARREFADGLKSNAFYACIGTFGDKFNSKLVGAPGSQSPITPVSAWIPEVVDEKLIDALFVGDAIAEQMNMLREQSELWRAAWKEPKQAESLAEGFEPVPQAPDEDDDIPM